MKVAIGGSIDRSIDEMRDKKWEMLKLEVFC